MPVAPSSSTISTVAPVVDYEPPARPTVPNRPRHPAALARPAQSRPANPSLPPPRPVPTVLPASLRSVALFADAALRRVLEVVDQRRPSTHLHSLLAAGLADSVLAIQHRAPGRPETATLQRIRVQPVSSGEPASAVEVFGTYRRGSRIHALACRVESAPRQGTGRTGVGWQIVALHIG